MNKNVSLLAAFGAVTILAGCIDEADYATTPVQVSTSSGVVTCQLYRLDQVLWDEAISAPPGMSIQDADQVCQNEGLRIIEGR